MWSLGPREAVKVKQPSPRALGAGAGATASPRVTPRVVPEGLCTPAHPGWLRHKSRPPREMPSCRPFPLRTGGASPAQKPSDVSFRKTPQRHDGRVLGDSSQLAFRRERGGGRNARSPALGSILEVKSRILFCFSDSRVSKELI